jgi:hypothetical protein
MALTTLKVAGTEFLFQHLLSGRWSWYVKAQTMACASVAPFVPPLIGVWELEAPGKVVGEEFGGGRRMAEAES